MRTFNYLVSMSLVMVLSHMAVSVEDIIFANIMTEYQLPEDTADLVENFHCNYPNYEEDFEILEERNMDNLNEITTHSGSAINDVSLFIKEIQQEIDMENDLFKLCKEHVTLFDRYFSDMSHDEDDPFSVKWDTLEEMKYTIEKMIDISSRLSMSHVISINCPLPDAGRSVQEKESIFIRDVRIDDPKFITMYKNWTLQGHQFMSEKDFHQMLDEKVEQIKTSPRHLKEHYIIRWNYIVSLMMKQNINLREDHWFELNLFNNFLEHSLELMKTHHLREKLKIITPMAKVHVQNIETGNFWDDSFKRQTSILKGVDLIRNTQTLDKHLKFKMVQQIKENYLFSGDHRGDCYQYCDEWNRHFESIINDITYDEYSVYIWLEWLDKLLTMQEFKVSFPGMYDPLSQLQEINEPQWEESSSEENNGDNYIEEDEERTMRLFGFIKDDDDFDKEFFGDALIDDEETFLNVDHHENQVEILGDNDLFNFRADYDYDYTGSSSYLSMIYQEKEHDLEYDYENNDQYAKEYLQHFTLEQSVSDQQKPFSKDDNEGQTLNKKSSKSKYLNINDCIKALGPIVYNHLTNRLNKIFTLFMVYSAYCIVELPFILVTLCYILLFGYCFHGNDDNYVKVNYIRI